MKLLSSIKKRYKKSNMYKTKFIYGILYDQVKLNENFIFYESYVGKNFTGNPYALFKELIKDKSKVHVITYNEDVKENILLNKILSKYKNVIIVKRNSLEYVYYLLKCKYLINNSTFHYYFNKKPNQIYINTWHGTPIKNLGKDINTTVTTGRNISRNYLNTDFFVSPNSFTTEVFLKCLDIDELYNKNISHVGYPRNDVFYKNFKLDEDFLDILKIDKNKKTILYAPTYRGNTPLDASHDLELYKPIFKMLDRLSSKYNVLVKMHYYVNLEKKGNSNISFVPGWLDTCELLSQVDILISDYSSISLDYLNTGRPILLYTPDKVEYFKNRGVYFELDELPAPQYSNVDELEIGIEKIQEIELKYSKQYNEARLRFSKEETGEAAYHIINKVFYNKETSNEIIQSIPSSKKNILIYGGGLGINGITTSFINFIKEIDFSKNNVYILVAGKFGKERLAKLNEITSINSGVKVLYRTESVNLNLLDYFKKIRKSKQWDYLPNDKFESLYRREYRRILGDYEFDTVIDYSGYNWIYTGILGFSSSRKKIIYIHNDMLQEKMNKPRHCDYSLLFDLWRNKYDFLVNVSKGSHATHLNYFPELKDKMIQIDNPIDTELIQLKSKEKFNELEINPVVSSEEVLTFRKNFPELKDKMIQIDNPIDTKLIQLKSKEKFNELEINPVVNSGEVLAFRKKCTLDTKIYYINCKNRKAIIKGNLTLEKNLKLTGAISLKVKNFKSVDTSIKKIREGVYAFSLEIENVKNYEDIKISLLINEKYIEEVILPKIEQRIDSIKYEENHINISGWMAILEQESPKVDTIKKTAIIYDKIKESEEEIIINSHEENSLIKKIEGFKEGNYSYSGFKFSLDIKKYNDGIFEVYLNCKSSSLEAIIPIKNYSEKMQESIKKNSKEDFINNYDVINKSKFGKVGYPSKENTNFISIGRYSYEKGYDRLIEAFAKLKKSNDKVKLYIIGVPGKGKSNIEPLLTKMVKEYGLENDVCLVGKLKNPMALLSECNCYVMSSRYEGQGLVLFESMLSGLTSISTNIPGPDSILEDNFLYHNSIEGIHQGMMDYLSGYLKKNNFNFNQYNEAVKKSILELL